MVGTEALNLMLTHENIESIMLLGSGKNRKRVIQKKDLPYMGLHINVVEINSDRWMVGIIVESDIPKKREVLWKRSVI
jgi:hypothetical protein